MPSICSNQIVGIDFIVAKIDGTEFTGTEKAGTKLNGTKIFGTEIFGTEFAGTELAGTELTGTEKAGTELTGTELAGTELAAPNWWHRIGGTELTVSRENDLRYFLNILGRKTLGTTSQY